MQAGHLLGSSLRQLAALQLSSGLKGAAAIKSQSHVEAALGEALEVLQVNAVGGCCIEVLHVSHAGDGPGTAADGQGEPVRHGLSSFPCPL